MRFRVTSRRTCRTALLACAPLSACWPSLLGRDEVQSLTIYAGRSELLMKPLLEQFSRDTGIPIRVRYGDGTDLALGILEEGQNSLPTST